MSFNEVLQIAGAIIVSIGGASGIIISLSSWLGKIWANKLMKDTEFKYQKDIEEYKSTLAEQLEKLKTKEEKSIYMGKVQYDIEIKHYQDLSEKAFEMFVKNNSLFTLAEYILVDEEKQKLIRLKNQDEAIYTINEFINYYGRSIPFIDSNISEMYDKLRMLCKSQIDCHYHIRIRKENLPDMEESAYLRVKEIKELWDKINISIKEYLSKIKVEN